MQCVVFVWEGRQIVQVVTVHVTISGLKKEQKGGEERDERRVTKGLGEDGEIEERGWL